MKNLLTNVRGDLTGGLTAGIVALPLALALGVAARLLNDLHDKDSGRWPTHSSVSGA